MKKRKSLVSIVFILIIVTSLAAIIAIFVNSQNSESKKQEERELRQLLKTKERKALQLQIDGLQTQLSNINRAMKKEEYIASLASLKDQYDIVCDKLNRPWKY